MASTETPAPAPETVEEAPKDESLAATEAEESAAPEVEEVAAPPPEIKTPAAQTDYFALADVVLRFLLFASAVVAVVVIVTGKQTRKVPVPAKFNHSPAFIYFVAALSTAALYSIITTLLSFYALLKPACCPKLLSHFIIFDVLLLGIVAAATGAAGSVAYIGLKGDWHVGWMRICNAYNDFCKHVGASVFVSLFASIVLAFLVLLSIYSLSKKIPRQ